MTHNKQDYIAKCVESGIPVLLEGTAGTGKTTIAKNLAKLHGKEFYALTGTKQTSINALIGFTSINGIYIPTQFREAFEHGHYFLIDEIDGMDSNVLLTLNTIENGYMAFPDKVVEVHPEFRLMATANPRNEQSIYTGRSKLDFSTLDRFFTIPIDRDPELELYLTSQEVVDEITIARKVLESNSSSRQLTMRDAIRIHRLKALGISEAPIQDVVFVDDSIMYKEFTAQYTKVMKEQKKASMTQSEASNIDELWSVIQRESDSRTFSEMMAEVAENSSDFSRDKMLHVLYQFQCNKITPTGYRVTQEITAGNPYGMYTVRHVKSNTEIVITYDEYATYAEAQPDYMPF